MEFRDGIRDERNEIHDNEDIKNEETIKNDSTNDQGCQESLSEHEESSNEILQGNEKKREDSAGEAQADPTQVQNGSETLCGAEEGTSVNGEQTSANYSCSYKPPHYVPDFTVAHEQKEDGFKRKSGTKLWAVALAAWVIAISVLGVLFIGFQLLQNRKNTPAGDASGGGEYPPLTVNKNDTPISIKVETDASGAEVLNIEQVVDKVADSVVEIVTTKVQVGHFGIDQYVTSGAGSGVLIDKEGRGYIITNQHVVGDQTSQTKITVRLSDGRTFDAEYIAGDATFDIAVLKIDGVDLPYASLGSSSTLKVGQGVVAIGNPLGNLGGTVTNGIISALDRRVVVEGIPMTLLQTNAEINPGNSGGGLFDMAGRLIGIVNAKQSATGIEGLGFAIPIDIAWKVASELLQYGYVLDQLVLPMEVEYSDEFYLDFTYMPAGVYITKSTHGELRKYDRIVSINNITINTMSDYYAALDKISKGDAFSIVVSRSRTNRLMNVQLVAQFTEPPES